MTDAIRSSFEADYPHAKSPNLRYNEKINKYEFVEDDGVSWMHSINREWNAYQQGYLAAKSEAIVLPAASFHEHVEDDDTGKLEDAYTRSEITTSLESQGYQVKES